MRGGIDRTLKRPLFCRVKIPTFVLHIEIWVRHVVIFDPIVSNQSHVGVAFEFLA